MKKGLYIIFILFILLASCKKNIEIVCDDEIMVGETMILSAKNINEEYHFEVNDEQIAIITDNMFIALNEGEVTLTLVSSTKTIKKTIKVIKSDIELEIIGEDEVIVGSLIRYEAKLSKTTNNNVTWNVLDNEKASINDEGEFTPKKVGKVIITATINNNTFSKEVIIHSNIIEIKNIDTNIEIGDSLKLDILYDDITKVKYQSLNPEVATIDDEGIITPIKAGRALIKAYIPEFELECSKYFYIVKASPKELTIRGSNVIEQGLHYEYSIFADGFDDIEVVWESSNKKVAIIEDGIILGVKDGVTTITASSITYKNLTATMEVEVIKHDNEGFLSEDIAKSNEILNKMTLKQKVGQMFTIGFSGVTFSNDLSNAIRDYNFGNVIYMGNNVTNPELISELSNSIQNKMISENMIPAFISIDQEGGRVARITNGGTHFISNMALAATNDETNSYNLGIAMGKELKNYGINVDFAPVMDVNNNPNNPIIGVRSYSDNPLTVSLYGKNMFNGLKQSKVMGCAKHFPGHGNTSVDSHYGLPSITSTKDELYQTELAPFISAVSNGIDAIMTTHIIFTAIDKDYPATLSNKVLTKLLREELGYKGLIITDGMEMNAVSKNFGSYDETAVLAVKAGVDMLLYTSTYNPKTAYDGLMSAISKGEISIERINDSVRSIILTKMKYNLFEDYLAKNENISSLLEVNEQLNIEFAKKSLTLAKGDFKGLDKTKSTLIISPTTQHNLGPNLTSNSLANYAQSYLLSNGHENVKYMVVDNNASSSQITNITNEAKKYDQIVIALSDVKTKNYTNSISLVNKLSSLNKELVVIALDTPYDILSYNSISNYICVYGYQTASVIAISKYLNGEYVATGKLPIAKSNIK